MFLIYILSYTIDVFNKEDQIQVMTGNAAQGGLGGFLGFWLSSVLPTMALPVNFCYLKLIWLSSGT